MRYEPAVRVASGPQPGAVALRDYAHGMGLGDAGIYNPRTVRGSVSALSLHAEGRAVDLTIGDRDDAALTGLLHLLVEHHEQVGVQQVIWQRAVWTVGKTWRPYTGTDPHTGHAHVELSRVAAAGLTVEAITTILGDDMTPEQDQLLRDLHAWMSNEGKRVALRGDGIDHLGQVVGLTQDASKQIVAAMPTALDVGLLADAVAAALSDGPRTSTGHIVVSPEGLVAAVKQALREGTA